MKISKHVRSTVTEALEVRLMVLVVKVKLIVVTLEVRLMVKTMDGE